MSPKIEPFEVEVNPEKILLDAPFIKRPTAGEFAFAVIQDSEDDDDEDNNSYLFADIYKKGSSPLRWLVLLLALVLAWGPYYAYDNPAATQLALRDSFGVPDVLDAGSTLAQNETFAEFNTKFSLLYSVYSIPNTVWPMFAGALVDRFGVNPSNLAATTTALAGVVIVTGGIASHDWSITFAGRALFGLGTELMCISARMLVADWFLVSEISGSQQQLKAKGQAAFAMGFLLANGRLASVANDAISGLFDGPHVVIAYYISCGFSVLAVLAAICAWILDRSYERLVDSRLGLTQSMLKKRAYHKRKEGESPRPLNSLNSNINNGVNIKESSASGGFLNVILTLSSFPFAFWLLCLLCLFGYTSVVSFNNVAESFLQARYIAAGETGSSIESINIAMSTLFLSAAVVAAIAGGFVDRASLRSVFMIAASIVIVGAHATLALTSYGSPVPEVLFTLLGSSFAVFAAALWPSVPFFVPKSQLGLAYGIMGATQNLGLVLVPLFVSFVQPPNAPAVCGTGYLCVEILFSSLGGAAWILSILCLFEEMKVKKVVASSEISESLLQKEEGKENVANLSSTYNENDDYNNDD
jgi:MFS family permease